MDPDKPGQRIPCTVLDRPGWLGVIQKGDTNMHLNTGRAVRMGAAIAAAIAATIVMASSATAAVNDDFTALTSDGCGAANFIDYGEGAPGGGGNDDYIAIYDYCGDTHGVKAWAWITTQSTAGPITWPLGSKYNGNGLEGSAVIWDPFRDFNPDGNVLAGQKVRVRVCLVDGNSDSSPSNCGEATHTSVDG
jgi:hypothetical protein